MTTTTAEKIACSHCGETCRSGAIITGDLAFCCEGCKMVYQLLNENGLCDYYALNEHPGISQRPDRYKEKFAFLDDEKIAAQLLSFHNGEETHVTFYLPQIHCSSCLYLLENMHRLEPAILSSRVEFTTREIAIVFDHRRTSLRRIADLLTATGYEPYISLHELGQARPKASRQTIYRLGIAGFCFANIMLLSFPEYLGLDKTEPLFQSIFRWLSLALSLPVLLYSAQPFYISAWKGLRHRFLNIDAPIALAILVTFTRSAYEVITGAGSGYFDSMTGIVFFMLAGRALQDRTYRQLSFERDYTSYFPVAVSVLENEKESPRPLPEVRCGNTLRIHHQELIPADGILTRGQALIDYSFVTGESLPVIKEVGELIYAGGKQTGAAIEMLVVKEVAQSYLTRLWNRHDSNPDTADLHSSFIHLFSRYFTYIVLAIASAAALYWWSVDPLRIGNAVTAVLIIACPCALLLSSTFTNGNILRVLARNRLYLRNAQVIEEIATTTHIVFDKTGTLTTGARQEGIYEGRPLSNEQQDAIAFLASQSSHPLSRAVAHELDPAGNRHMAPSGDSLRTVRSSIPPLTIGSFHEEAGKGIEGSINGHHVTIGSPSFINHNLHDLPPAGTRVYIGWDKKMIGHFSFFNQYRGGIAALAGNLSRNYHLSILSGDTPWEGPRLAELMGKDTEMHFGQSPHHKTRYVEKLQATGARVMMIGDGLNDAGALRQANTGIAISENDNNFTPASDAILDAAVLHRLPAFIAFCRMEKKIVITSFVISILYNIIGLSFAVRGNLSPMIAAILMPMSSLSILLLTYGCSNLLAKWLGLSGKH